MLRNPANVHHAVSLTADEFQYSFGSAVSAEEPERWTVPAPGRPQFEAAVANFAPHSPAEVATGNADRGPLL
ncbi:hypothetical protein [Dactylosporangium sp. CA-233914]|uniref:hypothetical protein n=1 Tax=Dactylosporangium sp. CA-233914 TaxID=3239934 RepID=UPI003D909ED1